MTVDRRDEEYAMLARQAFMNARLKMGEVDFIIERKGAGPYTKEELTVIKDAFECAQQLMGWAGDYANDLKRCFYDVDPAHSFTNDEDYEQYPEEMPEGVNNIIAQIETSIEEIEEEEAQALADVIAI